MGKRFFAGSILLMLLLCGCHSGGEETAEALLASYQSIESASMTAELICHYEEEIRSYTMEVAYARDSSRVVLLSPEELEGIGATISGDTLTLTYDDILLDAGEYSGTELTPLWAIPASMDAILNGYPIEILREDLEDTPCVRVTFEVTENVTSPTYFTLWFGEDTSPLRGEITVDGTMIYEITIQDFTKEGTIDGDTSAADVGGN